MILELIKLFKSSLPRESLLPLKIFLSKRKIKSRSIEEYLTLSPTSRLLPESKVENFSNDKTKITIGHNSCIRGRLTVSPAGGAILIGEWCYVGHRTEIFSLSLVNIGNRVLIAHDVNIVDNTAHSLDPVERHNHYRQTITSGRPERMEDLPGVRADPIFIEDDVWISFGVTILKGVTIGARSVVAAGSIVTHNIPPDTFYRCRIEPIMTLLTDENKDT